METKPSSLVKRNEKGQVLPGSRLAKGNAGRTRMAKLRHTLVRCVGPEKVRQAEAKLFEMFMSGDSTAARIWMDHVLGKPLASVEIGGPQGSPISIGFILAAIREAVPDLDAQVRIAEVFHRLAAEGGIPGQSKKKAINGPSQQPVEPVYGT